MEEIKQHNKTKTKGPHFTGLLFNRGFNCVCVYFRHCLGMLAAALGMSILIFVCLGHRPIVGRFTVPIFAGVSDHIDRGLSGRHSEARCHL